MVKNMSPMYIFAFKTRLYNQLATTPEHSISIDLYLTLVFNFGTFWCPSGQIDSVHIWGFEDNSEIKVYFGNY